ncbi:MAG TPA: tagaturonate reductase, partial [Cytophagales bacterium]|nr:tagaturonate reductase [Cytophagales bacterium]
MLLTKENIKQIKPASDLLLPQQQHLSLPERVIEFGTGVLLRGLPNQMIDGANKRGVFNGRVVVVKSTDKGGTEAFALQQGLYTVCVRGISEGLPVDQKIVNASISRVLTASTEWEQILECASNLDINIVISNVTEVGMKLVKEDRITDTPPCSFPGKLLAYLHKRYQVFNGSVDSGMVILPTELIPDNGKVLKNILLELAALNQCTPGFMEWLAEANDFCSTLVDRIVPGALPKQEQLQVAQQLGYEDQLMIMAEPYSLWAIETSRTRTREILTFATVDPGVVIAKDINHYREIKIRLLNAPHTFCCALALVQGFDTVKQAMDNVEFRSFITELMLHEIIPVLVNTEISQEEAVSFAGKVLDRFSNPYIAHEWLSISAQYTSKIALRCVPILLNYYNKYKTYPRCITKGFAAYLLFMKSEQNSEGRYEGHIHQKSYLINDDKAARLHAHWTAGELDTVVQQVLADHELWGADLSL